MPSRRGRFLIMIDQATRDAVGQLLAGYYLERLGHSVRYCNQVTLAAMAIRFRPDVLYASWIPGGRADALFESIRHRTRIVLVDQEGRRAGEDSFKRALRLNGGAQIRTGQIVDHLVAWDSNQARWIAEFGIPEDRISVVGSARLDPYMRGPAPTSGRTDLGITLRTDPLTSDPLRVPRAIFDFRNVDPALGLRPALPATAQYEDWIWEVISITRHQMRAITAVRERTSAPILVRPGPWERYHVWDFLPGEVPNLRVVPSMLQHEYLERTFATIDCYSTLGIEGVLTGTPVISIIQLIAGLEDHVGGGVEGTRFSAPYRRFYWQPKDFDELVDLVLRAEAGELPTSPESGIEEFMRAQYGWPGPRPASFLTADLLIRLLDEPPANRPVDSPRTMVGREALEHRIHRWIPGSTWIPRGRLFWRYAFGTNRDSLRRYHYAPSLYAHHDGVRKIFDKLWTRYAPR